MSATIHQLVKLGTLATLFLLCLTYIWHTHVLPSSPALAIVQCTCPDGMDPESKECNEKKLQCLQEKIAQTSQEAQTLQGTIDLMNGQIQLQEVKIKQTKLEIAQLEREITDLSGRITGLNTSLDQLTKELIIQVQLSYQNTYRNPLESLLASRSLDEYMIEQAYLKYTQNHLAELMRQAESTRLTYTEQKTLKEQKSKQLDGKKAALQKQQAELAGARKEKEVLLTQTRNDEALYQQELAKTLGEIKAIQGIVSGYGNEVKVRDVQAGETIASVIPGASACSTGAHLHFEVVKDKLHRNPSEFLKGVSINWDNTPDGPFGFSGNWDWPLNNPARITQGFGMTWYARVRRAYGGQPHSGIDMKSKTGGDWNVKAVQAGSLSRGSIKCGSGQLRYVKVEHKDGGLSTYYLHVNY